MIIQSIRIAKEIIDFTDNRKESEKILVTDLDETLWRGILGEDGIEKISADQDQNSFPTLFVNLI